MSPYRVDARLAGRHPFEIYLLALALLVTLPTLFGVAPRPGSVASILTGFPGFLWNLSITAGSALALVGIYWKDRIWGLIGEQLGLALVGVACLVYTVVVLASTGWSALFPAAIVAGFGASCIRRYFQIQQTFNQISRAEQD